jgi:hypothetical protein
MSLAIYQEKKRYALLMPSNCFFCLLSNRQAVTVVIWKEKTNEKKNLNIK